MTDKAHLDSQLAHIDRRLAELHAALPAARGNRTALEEQYKKLRSEYWLQAEGTEKTKEAWVRLSIHNHDWPPHTTFGTVLADARALADQLDAEFRLLDARRSILQTRAKLA